MRILLVLFFALTSCARATKPLAYNPNPVYYITAYTPADIMQVYEYVVKEVGFGPEGEWGILLTSSWIQSPNPDNPKEIFLADGITIQDEKTIVVFAWQECLADSALVHELLHSVGYDDHKEVFRSHVERIEKEIVKDLCPPGYQSKPRPPPHAEFRLKDDKSDS